MLSHRKGGTRIGGTTNVTSTRFDLLLGGEREHGKGTRMSKHALGRVVLVIGVLGIVAGSAGAQGQDAEALIEAPTFKKLDGELSFYKGKAGMGDLECEQCEFGGVAYHNIFDMFLTVMNDPKHPKHAETRRAWEANHAKFKEQARMVSMMMGNLVPLLITTSGRYAKDFQEGAKLYAPSFNPADYVQPLAVTVGEGDEAEKAAWFHGDADADGDGVKNRDELLAVAPNWLAVKDENGATKQGTGVGVTKEDRDRYVAEALGCTNWRKIAEEKAAADAESKK